MEQTLTTILPGITIYTAVFLVSQFVVHHFRRTFHALTQFFVDSAEGRALSRQTGYRLKLPEADEPHLHARLIRSTVVVTWFGQVSIAVLLVFVVGTITIIGNSTSIAKRFRELVFVSSALHFALSTVSFWMWKRNERKVMAASKPIEY